MPLFNRPGAFRYMLLASLLWVLAKSFEAMGDRAVLIAGVGHGQGVPWYLLALVLLIAAFASFLFGVRRIYLRSTGRLTQPQPAAPDARDIVALSRVFADETGDTGFDPDAALARYMARQPESDSAPSRNAPEPPRGGFGRKGL